MEFCKLCNSIMQNGACTNRHCTSRNEALMSWLIDGTLQRFRRPVTIAEAREAVKNKSEIVYKVKPPSNGFTKMPIW